MLLTPLLSASPLAVPHAQLQLAHITTTTTTTTTTKPPPLLIRKIRNWAEKPPDPPPNQFTAILQRSERRKPKDLYHLHIPSPSALYSNTNYHQQQHQQPPPPAISSSNNQNAASTNISTDANSVYFGKSFIDHSTPRSVNSSSIRINNNNFNERNSNDSEPVYSNLSYLKSKLNNLSSSSVYSNNNINRSRSSEDIKSNNNNNNNENDDQETTNAIPFGSSYYYNDASVLEAKRYRELLQQRLQNKQTRLQHLQQQQQQSPSSNNVFHADQVSVRLPPPPPQVNNTPGSNGVLQEFQITTTVKIIVYVIAVITISILGLIVGALFGAPRCLPSATASSTSNQQQQQQTEHQYHQTAILLTSSTTTTATQQSSKRHTNNNNNNNNNKNTNNKNNRSRSKRFGAVSKAGKTTKNRGGGHHKSTQENYCEKDLTTRKPDHSVPMLSVQTPGCAGMERLGVPTRTSITSSTPRDDRHPRIRHDRLHESSITTPTKKLHRSSPPPQEGHSSAGTTTTFQSNTQYPHHIQLPDGEYGADRDMQLRDRSQQSELHRTYPIPPPNKCVSDVPTNYRGGSTSTSVTNLNEHFGSGRSITNASSTSAPVSKGEKSKHKFIFGNFFKSSTKKSPEPNLHQQLQSKQLSSSSSSSSSFCASMQLQQQSTSTSAHLHQNNNNINSSSHNNYSLMVTSTVPSLSSPSVSPTFTNNPPLDSRIGGYSGCGVVVVGGAASSSGTSGTNLLTNFSSDLSPSASQLSVVAATCLRPPSYRSVSPTSSMSGDDTATAAAAAGSCSGTATTTQTTQTVANNCQPDSALNFISSSLSMSSSSSKSSSSSLM